ncbi:DUF551 domain-containing protein [Salmonella enterica]|nr:DUF551 domain-containing protein [Salmonella enterica]
MTTNHPAHGPVSLDRLHQIREILSKAAAQSDGGNLGYAMANAVKVIDWAIATFGAEPAGYADPQSFVNFKSMGGKNSACTKEWMWRDPYNGLIPLYAAPPAPVVPEGLRMALSNAGIAAPESDEMLAATHEKYIQALVTWVKDRKPFQPAQLVPEEVSWEDVPEEITEDNMEVALAWAHGFNHCRSSMLQAGNSPVIPDGWIPVSERMPEVRKPVYIFHPEYGVDQCAWYDDKENAFTWDDEFRFRTLESVSHWMAMPALPAAPQQEVKSALEHGMQRYAGAMQKLSEGDK